MNVAFLLYGIPQNGGVKVLFRVGNLLQDRGFKVTYFVAEPERELPFPSECSFVFAPKSFRTGVGRVSWLAQSKLDTDIAIATSHHTSYALVWNRSSVPRRLYYVQAYEPDFYSDSVGHLARRWPLMLAAGCSYLLPLEKLVNCAGSRRGLTWRDRMIAQEFPPGIDLGLYHPRRKAANQFVIGHISRREHWKGSDHFFRAMVQLRQLGYDFRVRVAYDLWPHTHGLQYEAVHPRIESELAEYYAGLDALVSTVTQKGFGLPPLEAMASGSVCISTPIDFGKPGVDHIPILSNSSGSIVAAVRNMFAMPDRASLISGGLRTAEAYSWSVLADRWCAFLRQEGVEERR